MADRVFKQRVTHPVAWKGKYGQELPMATFNTISISGFQPIPFSREKETQNEALSFYLEFMMFTAA